MASEAGAGPAAIPAAKEKRDELFDELRGFEERLADAKEQPNEDLKNHKKRMTQVFGFDPVTIDVEKKLHALNPERRDAVARQILKRIEDRGFIQENLLDRMEGDAPVFDGTEAGERSGRERRDDPAKARKQQTEAAPPPPPSPGLSPDEALQAFEANKDKAPKGRGRKRAAEAKEADAGGYGDQLRATSKAGEDHIRQTAEKLAKQRGGDDAGPPPGPPPPPGVADDDDEIPEPGVTQASGSYTLMH